MNSPNNIMAQVLAKDALQAALSAASEANEQAIAREQSARREHDRLSAQLSEVRARIQRDRRSHGAADDEDLEREAELARDLAAAESAQEAAATEAGNARLAIKEGMGSWLEPVQVNKDAIAAHLADIAAAAAEVARIDSAILRHEQDSAARQAARAAEGDRHQEELARFLAGKTLGEIPAEAIFEPPPAAPDDGTQAADSATLSGLAVRRGEAVDRLTTLQSAMDAIRAATILADLESVLRDYAPVAGKEQRLRTRANALRAILELDHYEVRKPGYLRAPEEEPVNAGVNQERDRLAGAWPALWATSPH